MYAACNTDERAQSVHVFRAITIQRLCRLEVEDFRRRTTFRAHKTTPGTRRGWRGQREGHGGTACRTRVSDNDDCQCKRLVHGQFLVRIYIRCDLDL